jgi:hypothetical protein
MRVLPLVLLVLTACGGSSRVPAQPLGVTGHLQRAQQCDADAAREDALAADAEAVALGRQPTCGDTVLADQSRSGNEPLVVQSPCWTRERTAVDRHRQEAERLRAEARAHRETARALIEAEDAACASMPADQLDHTPFAHIEDVVGVVAELDSAELRGARIQFQPVAGLTAEWMRTAIACHRARAATVGFDARYMSYDPSLVDSAAVTVEETDAGLVVTVRASDDADALVIYARAEALLGGDW